MDTWIDDQVEREIFDAIKRVSIRKGVIAYFPQFTSQEEFNNHYHRARWYLPLLDGITSSVHMGVTDSFSTEMRPSYMCPPRADGNAVVLENVLNRFAEAVGSAQMVLRWKPCSSAVLDALKARGVSVVNVDTDDPKAIEYGRYAGLLWDLMSNEERARRTTNSKDIFLRHAEVLRARDYYAAAVFGTGPSIDLANQLNFSGIMTIACNSIVQDRDLLNHISPSFISAGDVVSHLGVSKYAERYREDLYQFLKSSDCYFLTSARFSPLITTHYPEIADRVLVCEQGSKLPVLDLTKQWLLPSLDSVLNIHMLPLAATFAKTIFVLGCDGKNPDPSKNEDFWAHSTRAQYHDLVDSGHKSHPTFDINRQKSTYSRFLDSVALSIDFGERNGKIYIALAASHTLPIQRRAIDISRLPRDRKGLYRPVVDERMIAADLEIERVAGIFEGFSGSEILGRCASSGKEVEVTAYHESALLCWTRSDASTGQFRLPLPPSMRDGRYRTLTLRAGFGGQEISNGSVEIKFPSKRRVLIIGRVSRHGYSGGRYHALVAGEALAMWWHDVTLWITAIPPFFKDLAVLPKHRDIKLWHEPWDNPPSGKFDFIYVIPDSSYDGAVYEAAVTVAKRDDARLALFNFESPNWFNREVEHRRNDVEWYWWKRVAQFSDVILCSATVSGRYAREYYDTRALFRVASPAINTVAADRSYSVNNAHKQIIIISRFGEKSRHKGLKDIEGIITPKLNGYTLAFVTGTGKHKQEEEDVRHIEELCRGVGAKVKILKNVSDAEKFSEIAKSHFMVFPSYFEGFGYPPIESLYMGRPCVCYDLPVLREISGDALIYVPKGNIESLREAVNDLIEVADMAPRADLRERVRLIASVQRFGIDLQRIMDEAIGVLPAAAAKAFAEPLGNPMVDLAQSLVRTERDAKAYVNDVTGVLAHIMPGLVVDIVVALLQTQAVVDQLVSHKDAIETVGRVFERVAQGTTRFAELREATTVASDLGLCSALGEANASIETRGPSVVHNGEVQKLAKLPSLSEGEFASRFLECLLRGVLYNDEIT